MRMEHVKLMTFNEIVTSRQALVVERGKTCRTKGCLDLLLEKQDQGRGKHCCMSHRQPWH